MNKYKVFLCPSDFVKRKIIIVEYNNKIIIPVLLPVKIKANTDKMHIKDESLIPWCIIILRYSRYAIKVNTKYDEYTCASDI